MSEPVVLTIEGIKNEDTSVLSFLKNNVATGEAETMKFIYDNLKKQLRITDTNNNLIATFRSNKADQTVDNLGTLPRFENHILNIPSLNVQEASNTITSLQEENNYDTLTVSSSKLDDIDTNRNLLRSDDKSCQIKVSSNQSSQLTLQGKRQIDLTGKETLTTRILFKELVEDEQFFNILGIASTATEEDYKTAELTVTPINGGNLKMEIKSNDDINNLQEFSLVVSDKIEFHGNQIDISGNTTLTGNVDIYTDVSNSLNIIDLSDNNIKTVITPETVTTTYFETEIFEYPYPSSIHGIYVINISSIEKYDTIQNTWTTNNSSVSFYPGAVAFLDTYIYVIGGEDFFGITNRVRKYNLNNNEWTYVTLMNTYRDKFGVAVLNNQIYAIGGYDDFNMLSSVEKYDPSGNSWTNVTPMLNPRQSHGVAVFDGFIYVFGGIFNTTVEKYDPIGNNGQGSWTQVSNMDERRGVGVAVFGRFIYVIGGNNGTTYLKTVRKYDPTNNEWSDVSSMNTEKAYMSVNVIDGFIYVIGGQNDFGVSNANERYNPISDEWTSDVASYGTTTRTNSIAISSKKNLKTIVNKNKIHTSNLSGIQFEENTILPTDGSGNITDGTVSLGSDGNKWNNLYIDGIAYFGSTGNIQLLSDGNAKFGTGNIQLLSDGNAKFGNGQNIELLSNGTAYFGSGSNIKFESDGDAYFGSGSNIKFLSNGNTYFSDGENNQILADGRAYFGNGTNIKFQPDGNAYFGTFYNIKFESDGDAYFGNDDNIQFKSNGNAIFGNSKIKFEKSTGHAFFGNDDNILFNGEDGNAYFGSDDNIKLMTDGGVRGMFIYLSGHEENNIPASTTSGTNWSILNENSATAISGGNHANAYTDYMKFGVISEYSIITKGSVLAKYNYGSFSDRRIKTNIIDVPDNLALQQVRDLPCRYYEYKDILNRGFQKTIGYIAQEVKEVLPMGVKTIQEIIPNEYHFIENPIWEEITDSSGNVKFNLIVSPTDFSDNTYMNEAGMTVISGIKYEFYVTNDLSQNETRLKIDGNPDNRSFTFDEKWDYVFMYGREVDDFLTIDKAKICALHHASIQEMDRLQTQNTEKIQLLQSDNETLKHETTTLKQENESIKEENLRLNQEINTLKIELQAIKQHLGL